MKHGKKQLIYWRMIMKIELNNLHQTLVINAKAYKISSITSYSNLLFGVRKVVVSPQNKIGKDLQFIIWLDDEVNRIIEL